MAAGFENAEDGRLAVDLISAIRTNQFVGLDEIIGIILRGAFAGELHDDALDHCRQKRDVCVSS